MIRIMICGEGRHEFGDENEDMPGWMQVLLAKISNKKIVFSIKKRGDLFLPPKRMRRFRPLPEGHGRKALLAKVLGVDSDIIVYMVDADDRNPKRHREIVQEILSGFQAFESRSRCVACVPLTTSECWLLADPQAWSTIGLADIRNLTRIRPEELWGAREAVGHPHNFFAAICEEANLRDDFDTQALIAGHLSLETVQGRCPKSFTPFLKDFKAAADNTDGCDCGEDCCTDI